MSAQGIALGYVTFIPGEGLMVCLASLTWSIQSNSRICRLSEKETNSSSSVV